MAIWPPSLPAPNWTGFQETSPNVVIRTSMDVGPPKVRRRSTAGVRPLSMTFLLTKDDVSTLDTFYQTTLSGGSLPFDWTHPRTGAAVRVQFTASPSYQAQGPLHYQAQCQMEILP
jgi:hypothetical protein